MLMACLSHSVFIDNAWILGQGYLLLAQTMYVLYKWCRNAVGTPCWVLLRFLWDIHLSKRFTLVILFGLCTKWLLQQACV